MYVCVCVCVCVCLNEEAGNVPNKGTAIDSTPVTRPTTENLHSRLQVSLS